VCWAALHFGSTNTVRVAPLCSQLARGGSSDIRVCPHWAGDARKVVSVAGGIVTERTSILVAVRLWHCESLGSKASRGDQEGSIGGSKVDLGSEDLGDCRGSKVVHAESVEGNVAKEGARRGSDTLDIADQPEHSVVVVIGASDGAGVVKELPGIASSLGDITACKGGAESRVEDVTGSDSSSGLIIWADTHLCLKRDSKI
jgi:hypothetical protein